MSHRAHFMMPASAFAIAVITIIMAAPATNATFNGTKVGTTSITFSNNPALYPPKHSHPDHPEHPAHPPHPTTPANPRSTAGQSGDQGTDAAGRQPSAVDEASVREPVIPSPIPTPTSKEGSTSDEAVQ